MEIQIPKEMDKRLKKASDILGFEKQEIIDRALLFYLDTIQKQMELKKEFKEWDILSDEALINFEKVV